MFYSQFILAKKGPLGTIWIAAHLDRKLRKNQVADTDIGVSVDSIIFPEVPIALRLSSHLMLGVVRIYSRKVNYLFHDCSEALLKIKQAFRSTAVDLPPEESTAPYHSITLPETFHLDDFELPDIAFQGDNDHHVSTKEQITLQDNPEKTGYSTSQFGLDERFGDGNSSHIGLDLEEELLLNKDHSIQIGSDDGIIIQVQSSVPATDMDIDDNQTKDECGEGYNMGDGPSGHSKLNPSNSDDLGQKSVPSSWHGYNIQTPDLNEMFFPDNDVAGPSASYNQQTPLPGDEPTTPEFICAQAPATPGLMEETVPSRVHESPVVSPQRKASPSSNDDTAKVDNSIASVSDLPHSTLANGNNAMDAEMTELRSAEPVEVEPYIMQEPGSLRQPNAVEDLQPQVAPQDATLFSIHSGETPILEAAVDKPMMDTEMSSSISRLAKDSLCGSAEKGEDQVTTLEDGPLVENNSELCVNGSNEPSATENPTQINEASTDVEGYSLHVTKAMEANADFQQNVELITEDIPSSYKPDVSSISEFPEPEKMLLASNVEPDQANDLGQITKEKAVTESDGSNKTSSLTSRKRQLEDSLPALETVSTGKLSGRSWGRRTNDFIPNDDDLLASILVGKRTPGLRLDSTSPPPKATSLKRPRLASKMATPKRKLQMDDAMVLHADTIRQQLIRTEDTRRIRKKAPCTRSEIWMIEKSSLEDELFHEPIFSCASEELINLHHQTYDIVVHPTIRNMELQGRPDMSEAEAQDSNNAGTSGAKDNSTLDHPPQEDGNNAGTSGANENLSPGHPLHAVLPNGAQSCMMQPEATNAPDATAASGLPIPSGKQVNNEFELVAGDTPDEGITEHLIGPENGAVILDNNTNADFSNDVSFYACVDTIDNINGPQDVATDFQKSTNSDTPFFELNNHIPGVDADVPLDCVTGIRDKKVGDAVLDGSDPAYVAVVDDMKEEFNNCVEGDPIVLGNKEMLTSEITGAESIQDTSGFPQPTGDENVVSNMEENSGLQENNLVSFVDLDSTGQDFAPKECSDFGSAIHDVDTDFLNYDDDVDYDEANDGEPNQEESLSLDNSGWSSRTRGVARYLKTLFDEESGLGRKSVAIDHLLSGKTRKEASRMFFETLVLKTKDYIDVEQPSPFDFVTVRPGIKLMKSAF